MKEMTQTPSTQPQPATIGTLFTFDKEQWKVSSADNLSSKPHLKASYISRGFDGHLYAAERVIEGTKKKAKTIYVIRGMSGVFQSMC